MEYHHLAYRELLHGDSLLQDKRYIKILNQMFPNCYILNREGKIFFSPELTPEQNKQNQLICLKTIPEMEEMKKNIAKNTIEQLLGTEISQMYSEKIEHSLDEFYMENTIRQIIEKAEDSKLTGYELAKFVHIELGKAIYYDNNYSVKKDDEGKDTNLSQTRDKNMLKALTDSSQYAQICKGMAEIYAGILNKLGIQAKAVGVAEKGLTHEVSVDEAKHYYTAFKIGEQEYAQDYLIESALARIKIGEAEIADIMPGICAIEEYSQRAQKGLMETKLSSDFLKDVFRRK